MMNDQAQLTSRILKDLNDVRTLLSQAFESNQPESFGAKLTCEFPIIAKNDLEDLGRCELMVEQAKSVSVESLFIQLISNQMVLPMEVLLPTFIHELAHTVTVPERRKLGSIPREYLVNEVRIDKIDPEMGEMYLNPV